MTLLVSAGSLVFLALAILVILFINRYKWRNRLKGHTLPPGPRGLPFLGSIVDFPTTFPWEGLRDWSNIHGDIMFLRLLNTSMLVVSSADIALDLLDKRSAIYSDKPALAIDELTGWDMNLGIMPYGQRWRSIRACFHQYFNSVATHKYHSKQTVQIHAFLRRSLDAAGKQLDPANIHLTLAATVLDIVYGLEVRSMEDEHVKLTQEAAECFVQSKALGKYWVDFMPFLKYIPPWVPGAAAAKLGARCRPIVKEMVEKPFRAVKSGAIKNSSMARDLFLKLRENNGTNKGITEQHIKDAAGVAYVVAEDTTYAFLQVFFCVMAMSPATQQKAQDELEMVVGPDRLPTYDDCQELKYIYAILLECLRWFPVTPLAVPHRLTTDDFYNGYFIPAGTLVVPNIWQMLRNPQDYPDPERFNPDRFMKDGELNQEVRDPSTLAFGFGRRICPGRHLAKDNLFLTMASVLHVFNIRPSLDEHGNELDPTPHMTGDGVSTYPDHSNYMFKPRSNKAEELIRATATN